MAFIEKTAFEARITNNDRENLSHIAGLYQASASAAAADCSAGLLCVKIVQTPCEGFSGVNNENTWIMEAAADADNAESVIYACDPYDVQLLPGKGGNLYAIGTETLGLGVPAGRYGNFTRIDFDGESVYRFGEGNVTVNTEGDTYFTIYDGLLTSVAEQPTDAGAIYFMVVGKGNFTEGAGQSFGYYDLLACKPVIAAAAAAAG